MIIENTTNNINYYYGDLCVAQFGKMRNIYHFHIKRFTNEIYEDKTITGS